MESIMTDTQPQSSVTVLVVEDDSLVRLVVADLFRDVGYNVIEGRDGQEALEILEVQPQIDALFTDVMMPRLDGCSLARIVSERWPHVALVITSGLPPESELPSGARFIRKPFTDCVLLDALRSSIRPKDAADFRAASTPGLLPAAGDPRGVEAHE
jgi:two-component system, response regulator PdtaR